MRVPIASLVTGTVFGAGLALSDMINPARVLAFLDLAGAWGSLACLCHGRRDHPDGDRLCDLAPHAHTHVR